LSNYVEHPHFTNKPLLALFTYLLQFYVAMQRRQDLLIVYYHHSHLMRHNQKWTASLTAISRHADIEIPDPSICFRAYSLVSCPSGLYDNDRIQNI